MQGFLIGVLTVLLIAAILIGMGVLWINWRLHQLAGDRYTDRDREKFISFLAGVLVPIIFRVKVEVKGLEYLNGSDRAVLFPNHQSFVDIPVLLNGIKRPHGYVAKIEMDHKFIISQGMRLIRCEFMDREDVRQSVKVISNAAKTVKSGHMMVIFPEGTRVVNGEMGLFKAGSFKIAQKSAADIFPVTIYNTPKAQKRWPKKTTVKVEVHPPLTPEMYQGMSTAQIAEKVEAVVKAPLKEGRV